ncbi:MAG: EF-Tu/IF-2/RF-3 family GTPase [Micrococcales bacterium]|nr:EF-Tu/IF-2/RF-3 family GTPase [Micrococcales bacterium]
MDADLTPAWLCKQEDHLRLEARVAVLEDLVANLRVALANTCGVVVEDPVVSAPGPDWGSPSPQPGRGLWRGRRAAGPSALSDAPDWQSPFRMTIDAVTTVTGRGAVVTGRVERGCLRRNTEVEIVGASGPVVRATVVSMASFAGDTDLIQAGDNVGLLLKGIKRGVVEPGQVVVTPGSADSL